MHTGVSKEIKTAAKFHIGQVVRIDTEMYKLKREHGNERYQRIVKVWPWTVRGQDTGEFGYTFLNGDECNEIFVRALTEKELGR